MLKILAREVIAKITLMFASLVYRIQIVFDKKKTDFIKSLQDKCAKKNKKRLSIFEKLCNKYNINYFY